MDCLVSNSAFANTRVMGLEMGEYVAIGMLRDYCLTYSEDLVQVRLAKFNGTQTKIVVESLSKSSDVEESTEETREYTKYLMHF